jgi:hypothetical protein
MHASDFCPHAGMPLRIKKVEGMPQNEKFQILVDECKVGLMQYFKHAEDVSITLPADAAHSYAACC